MVELVGLKNIIVHMYADVKHDLILDNLGEIITNLEKLL